MTRVHPSELGGEFLMMTGLSALIVIAAVNLVTPLLESPILPPTLAVLLFITLIGFFLRLTAFKKRSSFAR